MMQAGLSAKSLVGLGKVLFFDYSASSMELIRWKPKHLRTLRIKSAAAEFGAVVV
jgi:hypothetical protein